jgi:hypothetical protein
MPHNLHDWLRRIKAIEREYSSMRLAIDRLLADARRDPTILTGDLNRRFSAADLVITMIRSASNPTSAGTQRSIG